jgi:hypothetical protein
MNRVSVDIDLDDIYYQMNRADKQMMAEWLAEDDIMEAVTEITWPDPQSSTELDLLQAIKTVWDNRMMLGREDIAILNKIGNKTAYEGITAPGHGAC